MYGSKKSSPPPLPFLDENDREGWRRDVHVEGNWAKSPPSAASQKERGHIQVASRHQDVPRATFLKSPFILWSS